MRRTWLASLVMCGLLVAAAACSGKAGTAATGPTVASADLSARAAAAMSQAGTARFTSQTVIVNGGRSLVLGMGEGPSTSGASGASAAIA
jgi:hypothetical protein